jgi:hypothetical protein
LSEDPWPPVKLEATSGRLVLGDGDLPDGGVFLSKPYTAAMISETLRSLGLA